MSRSVILLLSFLLPLVATGTTPILQPLDEAVADFRRHYPNRCERVLASVEKQLGSSVSKPANDRLEHCRKYLENIRSELTGLARQPTPSQTDFHLFLDRISTDLAGFRRSIDAALIEASVVSSFRIEANLRQQLRDFWEDEYYFTWRFRHEIAPRR
jgi:hypothetical protein